MSEKGIGNFKQDKFIIGICPYLNEENQCTEKSLLKPLCKECSACVYKEILYTCLGFKDDGRFELIMSSKHLTDSGELARKIIKLLKAELIKE